MPRKRNRYTEISVFPRQDIGDYGWLLFRNRIPGVKHTIQDVVLQGHFPRPCRAPLKRAKAEARKVLLELIEELE
jgi:hypothetical protein